MRRIIPEIRPRERRAAVSTFLILFGVMAGHAIQETARDALFLASLPATRLAWVYLAIAAASLLLYAIQDRRQAAGRSALTGLLLLAAGLNLGFWFLIPRFDRWLLFAQYVWSGVFSTLILVRFWSLIGDLFTVSQAKRLFSFIGAGSVLGAMLGSAAAGGLAGWMEARHLLLASAGLFLVTAAGPLLLPPVDGTATRPPGSRSLRVSLLRPMRLSWGRPYLRRVGAVILLSFVALTLVDFLFKSTVAAHFAPEQLGRVFALSYLSFNLLSLAVQVFLVGWIVRSFGINRVLSILPTLLVGGALAVAAGGGVVAAFVLKAVDGGLKHSLQRTATEVLYVPLSSELRSRVKGFIDVMGQRGGQAVASLMILAVSMTGHAPLILGAVIIVLAVAWIRIASTLQTHYLNLFRESLSEVALQTQVEYPTLDLASLESLMAGLNSPKDGEVIAALDILVEQERTRLVPALILYHPSPPVVVRALELFSAAGRSDFLPITERLLEHENAEIRAATLRARAWVSPSPDLFRGFVADPSPTVRATALVGQISYGGIDADEAEQALYALAGSGTLEERFALARAIRFSPGSIYEGILLILAEAKEDDLSVAIADAMAEIRSPQFLPALMAMLPNPHLRFVARRALVSIGVSAFEQLDEALGNPLLNRDIRLQIPRTISEFSSLEAVAVLTRHLAGTRDGSVRFRILKALRRIREVEPELELDETVLNQYLVENLKGAYQLVQWVSNLDHAVGRIPARKTQIQGLIRELIVHKELQAEERIFEILTLIYPGEDVRSIYRGIRSGNRNLHASSLELLENLLHSDVREPILGLVDDLDEDAKLLRAGSFHRVQGVNYVGLLRQLLERPGVGMKTLVVYHIGEMGMNQLRRDLEALPSDLAGLVSREVDRTLALLDGKEA